MFSDPNGLGGAKVGGLAPGNWIVKYLDDDDTLVLSQEVQLNKAEESGPECP